MSKRMMWLHGIMRRTGHSHCAALAE